MRGNELNFEPGTAQAYSHTEFVLLRELLEKATGRSIEDLYQTEVLDPLDLTRTGYQTTPELPGPVLHAFSSDRAIYEDSTFWNPSWASDSGPLYSTLGDLGRWGPAFGQGRLLTPASFLQLTKRPSAAPPTGPYFATGFVVSNGWYFQNPNFNGYTGALGFNSALDMTIVVYATQPEDPKVVHPGFEMFQGLVEEFAPNHPLGI